jgi:hypothetical protein
MRQVNAMIIPAGVHTKYRLFRENIFTIDQNLDTRAPMTAPYSTLPYGFEVMGQVPVAHPAK